MCPFCTKLRFRQLLYGAKFLSWDLLHQLLRSVRPWAWAVAKGLYDHRRSPMGSPHSAPFRNPVAASAAQAAQDQLLDEPKPMTPENVARILPVHYQFAMKKYFGFLTLGRIFEDGGSPQVALAVGN